MKRITLLMIILLFLSSSFLYADSMSVYESCCMVCIEEAKPFANEFGECVEGCELGDYLCSNDCSDAHYDKRMRPCIDVCYNGYLNAKKDEEEEDQGCFIGCSGD